MIPRLLAIYGVGVACGFAAVLIIFFDGRLFITSSNVLIRDIGVLQWGFVEMAEDGFFLAVIIFFLSAISARDLLVRLAKLILWSAQKP